MFRVNKSQDQWYMKRSNYVTTLHGNHSYMVMQIGQLIREKNLETGRFMPKICRLLELTMLETKGSQTTTVAMGIKEECHFRVQTASLLCWSVDIKAAKGEAQVTLLVLCHIPPGPHARFVCAYRGPTHLCTLFSLKNSRGSKMPGNVQMNPVGSP